MFRHQSQKNTHKKIRQKKSTAQVFIRTKYTQNKNTNKNGDIHELTTDYINCIYY